VNRWIGIGWIILVLLIIGLWAGIRSASNPGGSLRDRRRPARPGPYSHPSSRCARHHEVAGPRSGHGQSPREARCGMRGMVLVGEPFPDAKAQVAAEVTCEPRMLFENH
jgi:hypothetical protein